MHDYSGDKARAPKNSKMYQNFSFNTYLVRVFSSRTGTVGKTHVPGESACAEIKETRTQRAPVIDQIFVNTSELDS